jgi:hypothetical protein
MAPILEPSGDAGHNDQSEPHRGLRLSDVEGIAAERLESVAECSLEEALARTAPDEPAPSEPQVADRIDTVGAHDVLEDTRERSLTGAPADRIEAAPENTALRGSPDEGNAFFAGGGEEAPAHEASSPIGGERPDLAQCIEAADVSVPAGPVVRLLEARLGEAGCTQASGLTHAFSPKLRLPALDVSVALVKPAVDAPPAVIMASGAAEPDAPTGSTIEDWQHVSEEVRPAPVDATPLSRIDDMQAMPDNPAPAQTAPASVPAAHTAAPQGLQPLASALDAAVQLAADASVAAEALESLKRLLEHKQQLESRHPDPAPGPTLHPAAQDSARAPTPVAPTRHPLPPLPLPLHAERGIGREPSRAMLAALRPRPAPERRGLDVRGFLAGFALSWAFGVVLYLFLTAG